MKIIVAGDGKVGLAITRLLSQEGHDIVAIDTKANIIEQNGLDLDVMSVVGNCATMDTLIEAGVEHTDVLIATTNADETNLLCCLTARKLNPTIHTIARIRNPEYTEQLYKMREDFGLSLIINPEKDAAKEIFRLLQLPGFLQRETFAKGRVEIVELKIEADSVLNGVQLSRMHYALGGKKVLVCAVIREGSAFIPTADTVFRIGDHIYVTAPVTILSHILKKLGITQKRIKYAMLIGGGRVGYYLTRHLIDAGIRVKIIENDPARCEHLAQILPQASIVLADGSSQDVLESEGLSEMDALVTLTGLDEQNVISSMYGKTREIPNVVTKVNHMDTTGMLETLSVGAIVSPKELSSANVVQYVRAMDNQAGAAVTLHKIANGRIEALEFVMNERSRYLGVPLKKLQLKSKVLIACITHRGNNIVPDGNSTFEIGDTVIVITNRDAPILQFNDIFA
ncbi:MAG: Trk system potassium transporter TrkA [Clostridia bacterium]|nr:Trk system potassium transporter TrkA [Clostridia bacterium]